MSSFFSTSSHSSISIQLLHPLHHTSPVYNVVYTWSDLASRYMTPTWETQF